MREFKIRVWDVKDNGWYYTVPGEPEDHNLLDTIYFSEVCQNEDKYIWEQYTGLKDKNGKEIYEGDIVRTKSPDRANFSAGAIEMVQQMFIIMNSAHYSDPEISHCEPLGYYYEAELEVVGNIHENPELLGGKECFIKVKGGKE